MIPQRVIQEFFAIARREFGQPCFSQFIEKLTLGITPVNNRVAQPANTEAVHVSITVQDSYVSEIIKQKYVLSIESILERILVSHEVSFSWHVQQGVLDLRTTPVSAETTHTAQPSARDTGFLSPKYTFDNFILGPSNQFAHAAAKAIVDEPGKCFNPLFIFGASGLGKTHLLRAIGFEVNSRQPERNIRYVPSEFFINDFQNACDKNSLGMFRKQYREVIDVFLLDDVQFLSGKSAIQEEFFYTFNAHYEQSKQIVVTSDKIPRNLTGLENRIRTRFEWGLIADIQPPEFETRIEIIKSKMIALDLDLDLEIIHFLASHFTNNIRELEGVLQKIKLLKQMSPGPITLDTVKSHLRPFLTGTKVSYDVDHILKTVADEFGCRVLEIKSNVKARDISLPRHISMYLIRKYTEKSYLEIGFEIGRKDHTTVIHGVRKIAKLIYESQELRHQIREIEERLKV